MAKSRIGGVVGHQGVYDPSGVDPAMRETLNPQPLGKLTDYEKNYLDNARNRESATEAIRRARHTRQTGGKAS